MAKKNKEKPNATIREYKKWRNLHFGLKAAVFPTAISPLAIEVIVNANTWFPEGKDHTTPAFGFAMALLATIGTVLAIVKKDSEIMKKVGAFVSIGIGLVVWGLVFKVLAMAFNDVGNALIYAGAGVIASAIEDTADKLVVKEKYEEMKKLADDNGFTKKGRWKEERRIQAEYDKKKNPVRYVPHD